MKENIQKVSNFKNYIDEMKIPIRDGLGTRLSSRDLRECYAKAPDEDELGKQQIRQQLIREKKCEASSSLSLSPQPRHRTAGPMASGLDLLLADL